MAASEVKVEGVTLYPEDPMKVPLPLVRSRELFCGGVGRGWGTGAQLVPLGYARWEEIHRAQSSG